MAGLDEQSLRECRSILHGMSVQQRCAFNSMDEAQRDLTIELCARHAAMGYRIGRHRGQKMALLLVSLALVIVVTVNRFASGVR